MEYNFTGAAPKRTINLGNAQGPSAAELAARARQERAQRELNRRHHNAAIVVQSAWRGRSSAAQQREQWLSQHGHLVAAKARGISWDTDGAKTLVESTRLLAFATRRTGPRKQRRSNDELKALAAWCDGVSSPAPSNGKLLLSLPLESGFGDTWSALVLAVMQAIFDELRLPGLDKALALSFLSLPAAILGADNGKSEGAMDLPLEFRKSLASKLLSSGFYEVLRSHLLSLPVDRKASPTLEVVVALALAPFRLFAQPPAAGSSKTASIDVDAAPAPNSRITAITGFTSRFLTIPLLSSRIPLASLGVLAKTLPFAEVTQQIVALKDAPRADQTAALGTPSLLANYLAFGAGRVPHLTDGKSLSAYLDALTTLQDALPTGSLASPTQASGSSSAMDLDEPEPAEPQPSKGPAPSKLDVQTYKWLSTLPSDSHLSSVLSASSRFPSSTRPALFRFIASTLTAWPAEVRDRVLNCIIYGYVQPASGGGAAAAAPGAKAAVQAPAGSAGFLVGGLVREIWRGWTRGNKLSRRLSTATAGSSAEDALSALADPAMASEWPAFVLLAELYSRCLLTIGDDEFYPPSPTTATLGSDRGSSSASASASSRNPLTLDEVISLSGLLRNLAFALYWHEGSKAFQNLGGAQGHLPGMRLTFLSLRGLVTKVLQQLHARDSRRRFAPDAHWLMVSELDMNAFIQTVILEEKELAEGGGDAMDVDGNGTANGAQGQTPSDDDDDDLLAQHRISRRIRAHKGGRKGLTAAQLAFLSPRLGVLNNIPFVIPFEVRVEVFRQFVANDRRRLRIDRDDGSMRRPRHEVKVRRGMVAEDGFTQLNGIGAAIKYPISIVFKDQFGNVEAGIDGGGLFKEFLTDLVKEAFDTDRGLWRATDEQEIYPNPHSYAAEPEQLPWYTFLGRVLGKALYEGILIDVRFASFFLSKWLNKQGYLDDLASLESLDKQLYRNLIWLKNYPGDVEADLALTFAVTDDEFGVKRTTELIPGGNNIAVTRENRLNYIYRMSHYRLTAQIRKQCDAFFAGLSEIIEPKWLRMFNREELRVLVSGTDAPIDLDDLRRNTVYGGYHDRDEVIDFFWQALEGFSQEERQGFLRFVTSCPSPPLLGFAALNPKLGIRHATDDDSRLPTSSTCVNLLKLPRYKSAEQCAQKLRYAISSGAGFDLS